MLNDIALERSTDSDGNEWLICVHVKHPFYTLCGLTSIIMCKYGVQNAKISVMCAYCIRISFPVSSFVCRMGAKKSEYCFRVKTNGGNEFSSGRTIFLTKLFKICSSNNEYSFLLKFQQSPLPT